MTAHNDRNESLGMLDDDADLRARFARMRASDAASVPHVARVVKGTPRSAWRRWLVPTFALGAAAAVALVLWKTPRTAQREASPAFAFVPGDLRVPTDYFLDVSPSLRADEIPDIGAVDWYPLSTPLSAPLASPPAPATGDTSRSH